MCLGVVLVVLVVPMVVPVLVLSCVIFVPGSCPPPTSLSTVGWSYRYSSMSKVCILYVYIYICSHFGSIPVQFETPCNKLKLRMAKGPLRLQAETYTQYKECKPGNCSYAKKRFRIMRFGPVQLKLEELDCITLGDWYDSETDHLRRKRRFKRLLVRAYRDWFSLVHIKNKIVKKKATSIDASSATLSQS